MSQDATSAGQPSDKGWGVCSRIPPLCSIPRTYLEVIDVRVHTDSPRTLKLNRAEQHRSDAHLQSTTEGCHYGAIPRREAGFLKLALLPTMQLPRTLILAMFSLTTLTAAAPSPFDSQDLHARSASLHARSGRTTSYGSGSLEPGSPRSRQGPGSPGNTPRRPTSPMNTPRRPASPSTPRIPTSPPPSRRIGADNPAFVSPPTRFGEHRRPLHADFRAPGGPVGEFPQQFHMRASRQSSGSLLSMGSLSLPGQGPSQPVGVLAGPPSQADHVEGHPYHLSCEHHSFNMPQTILSVAATRCEEVLRCHGRTPVVFRGSVEGWVLTLCSQKCHCVF